MGKHGTTIVLLVLVAGAGLLYWAAKKNQGGGGGVLGTIGGYVNGAMGLTQDVTENSLKTGETIGGGVKDAAAGVGGILSTAATDTRHVLTLGLW